MILYFFTALFIILFPNFSQAQVSSNFLEEYQPKAELGMGTIGLQTPFYPGAKQSQFRFIPFPFGIYRGEVFRADDEGTRARLINPTSYELGISVDFNFPVDSEDTNRRKGMPSLDTIIQIGPRFLYRFIANNPLQRLNLSIALRGAISTNFKSRFQERGLAFEPQISFWQRSVEYKATFFSYLNFSFASSKLNGYFYDIDNQYITPQRQEYNAQAGLLESTLGIGVSKSIMDNVMVFTGGSYRNLSFAANKDSPLIETTDNLGFIIGIIWIFHESEEKIKVFKPKI